VSGGSDIEGGALRDSEALAARLLAWGGDPGEAESLRAEVRGHAESHAGGLRIRGTPAPGLRALAKAAELYKSAGRGPRSLHGWLLKERNRGESAAFAPLLGDPAMGDWPWVDALTLSEPDTVAWCDVLRQLRPVVDEPIRRFLRVAFQVRRRQTWPAACRAWAVLAQRDEVLRDDLVTLWRACFASLGPRWPKTGLATVEARRALGPNSAHLLRHTLFLGACWRASGGDPVGSTALLAGADGVRLAGMPLPSDDADRSVVLLCLAELLPTDPEGIAEHLVARAREMGPDELSEVGFRHLLGRLPPGPAADAIRGGLLRPRWIPAGIDALWEWLETAAWFVERDDAEAMDRMLGAAAEGAVALRWRVGAGRPDAPVEALIERLRQLLDADRFAVIPTRRRAALIAETRLLMRTDDVGPLPWPALMRVAGASGSGMDGTVAEVGEPSLCVLLAERSLTSRTLMRDVVLSPRNVLRVGGIQDGFIAGQVAVQTERILRELRTDSDRVRFLWNLLQQDPPTKTFAELALVLRTELAVPRDDGSESPAGSSSSGRSHPLMAMVRAVSVLDERRDGDPSASIAPAFAELVSCTCALLGDDVPVGSALGALAGALEAAVDEEEDPLEDDAWLRRFEDVVLGTEPRGGLVGWAWWLASAAPDERELHEKRARSVKALARLVAAVRVVRAARPALTADQHDELFAASRALQEQIGPLGWPETRLVGSLLARLEQRSLDALAIGRRSRAAVQALERMLERADEQALAAVIRDPEQLALMPVDQLRHVHRDLLGQLRFADAEHLRHAVSERVRLPSRLTHATPLYAAVAGGTFLVLDVGDAWLGLVTQEAWWRCAATLGLALAASYGLLLNDLAPRMNTSGLSPLGRWRILAFRALPTFLQALFVSVTISALAMATLGSLSPTVPSLLTLALWSSLALFLGVFIGLVLQGQSTTRADG
jgi:hypothetical protein